MVGAKDSNLMGLHGQQGGDDRGYAMAALLVSLAIMAVLMSVAMPACRHLARREKEAELAFRGEQYARAIALFRAKNGNNFPPSLDVLVQGRYLRKKYKDPMTPDGEFRAIPVGNAQGQPGGAAPPQPGGAEPAAAGRPRQHAASAGPAESARWFRSAAASWASPARAPRRRSGFTRVKPDTTSGRSRSTW